MISLIFPREYFEFRAIYRSQAYTDWGKTIERLLSYYRMKYGGCLGKERGDKKIKRLFLLADLFISQNNFRGQEFKQRYLKTVACIFVNGFLLI